jgi:hypothetical protein
MLSSNGEDHVVRAARVVYEASDISAMAAVDDVQLPQVGATEKVP